MAATPKKILIVDDEKNLVEFIESVLVTRGHKVSAAHDGQEALRKLSHGDPDLMLLDMGMPKMGGMQLYSQICTRYGRSRFPVIVLTANDALTDFFESALVDRFMTKPFKIKDLLDAIELLLTEDGKTSVWIVDAHPESDRLAEAIRAERFHVRTFSGAGQCLVNISSPPQFILIEVDSAQTLDNSVRTLRCVPQLKNVPILVYARAAGLALADRVAASGGDAWLNGVDDLRKVFTAMRQVQIKNAEIRRS